MSNESLELMLKFHNYINSRFEIQDKYINKRFEIEEKYRPVSPFYLIGIIICVCCFAASNLVLLSQTGELNKRITTMEKTIHDLHSNTIPHRR